MSVLKKVVSEERKKFQPSNGERNQKADEVKPSGEKLQNKRSKRKRLSGKERLMERAFKIKDMKFNQTFRG